MNLESRIDMKLVIIANPIAGGGRAYRRIERYVRQWPHPAWEVAILKTRGPDHAGLLARDLIGTPPDLVAICGGDGTLNEVASRVPNPPFPIALLPAGTANVVARELKIPLNPVRALQLGLNGTTRRVDLGDLSTGMRRFLFVAGIGFDAYVVTKVRPELKKNLGMAAYAVAIASCLRSYAFPEFQVAVEGKTYPATSCLVCNAKGYGGGLLFCPDADMNDGLLDVLVLEGARRLGLARFLLQAWRGKPESHDWVHRFRARSVEIEGGADVPVQTDGEFAGGLPLKIDVLNSAFPLKVPPIV